MPKRTIWHVSHYVLAGALALSIATAMPKIAPGASDTVDTIVLEHKGREGEIYRIDIKGSAQISISIGENNGMEVRSDQIQRLEYRVEKVRFNGDTTTAIRVLRTAAEAYVNDQPTQVYDTGRHSYRAIMRNDENLAPILKLLDSSLLIEQGPDGVIKDFTVEGPDPDSRERLEQQAENMMRNNLIQYPNGPVRMGDTWLAGTRSTVFPSVGRLDFDLMAELVAIDQGDGYQNAAIAITTKNARYNSISQEQETFSVKSFEMSGSAIYAGLYGRIVSFMIEGELVLDTPPEAAPINGFRALIRSEAAQVQDHQEPKIKQVEECPFHVPVGEARDGMGPEIEISKGQEISEDRKSVAIFHTLIGYPTCRLHLNCTLPLSSSPNLEFQHIKQMEKLSETTEAVFVGSFIRPGMGIRATSMDDGSTTVCTVVEITNF